MRLKGIGSNTGVSQIPSCHLEILMKSKNSWIGSVKQLSKQKENKMYRVFTLSVNGNIAAFGSVFETYEKALDAARKVLQTPSIKSVDVIRIYATVERAFDIKVTEHSVSVGYEPCPPFSRVTGSVGD